jgi:pimeloyl-ACP methyl ester carboxylesterase
VNQAVNISCVTYIGFFTAAVVAHHCEPSPLALLSIEGINTFRHPFFNSSTLLTPEPLDDGAMAAFTEPGPAVIGVTPAGARGAFKLDKLRLDGSKNTSYRDPTPPSPPDEDASAPSRGALYDYYIYKNAWLDLVGDIDRGYEWAKDDTPEAKTRLAKWPPTVIFHGNADEDVPLSVSEQMRDCLGTDKASLFVVDGQPHLFELTKFIEDDLPEMEVVRTAVKRLDGIVRDAKA